MIKLCAILLSLGGLVGGVETILETHLNVEVKPEVAFSQNAPRAISDAPSEPDRAVAEALADAQGRDLSISDLFQPREEQ